MSTLQPDFIESVSDPPCRIDHRLVGGVAAVDEADLHIFVVPGAPGDRLVRVAEIVNADAVGIVECAFAVAGERFGALLAAGYTLRTDMLSRE